MHARDQIDKHINLEMHLTLCVHTVIPSPQF